ncbi:DUF5979 domain-containing protein [Corynebacterium auriscanis]|uniref:DUF5979 domain-containing protein n=1 Tax=Corynebacterium auriscanis TaxID=99807 RepID=UPI003CF50D83
MNKQPGEPQRHNKHHKISPQNKHSERHTMGIELGTRQQENPLTNATRTGGESIIAKPIGAGRRLVVALVAFVLGMTLMSVPEVPFVPDPPQAEAQDGNTVAPSVSRLSNNMGNCNFRAGDGPSAAWAKQLCWIDMSKNGANFNWANGERVTRKIGRYTLAFTAKVNYGPADRLTAQDRSWANAAFGNSKDGVRTFTKYGDDTSKPFLFGNMGLLGYNFIRFSLENITLVDERGVNIPNFRIMMADAEATTESGVADEMISMENREGNVERLTRITPSGFSDACNGIYGPANEPANWGAAGSNFRDFVCFSDKRAAQTPGTFLASAANPKNIDFALGSSTSGSQAIALAINIGRVAGSVSSDTAYEQAVTGQATKFDITAATRQNNVENPIPLPAGDYTTATRIPAAGTTGNVVDDYVFRSKATGTDASKAFSRYNPVWTCTIGDSAPVTIKEGAVPNGYSLIKNQTAFTSELVVAERRNDPTNCQVDWQPKFQASNLQLSKTVNGTAALFDEVQLRTFQLNYKCTDINQFSSAYPDVKLTGSKVLQKGQSATVPNLPLGTTCTINETFPDGAAPARPGKKLTLTWNTGTASGDPLPTTTQTLEQSTVSVRANNQYDYRAGVLHFSKELSGDPVGDFAYPRQYDFELTCDGTTVKNRHISLSINRQGSGVPAGATDITDIPVERDCWLKPLTGLSAQESARIKFDGRDVTYAGKPVSADAEGAYHFRLPDYAEGSAPTQADLHINAKYSYQLRDVKVFKELAGNAAASPDLKGKAFPVQYRCTWGGTNNPQQREGTLDVVTLDTGVPARIKSIPVGARCLIWEQDTPEFRNVKLTSTELTFADPGDNITTLTNEQAKATPIITVNTDSSDSQNVVHVRNTFEPKLGKVQLNKAVNRNGLSVNLPSEYRFDFDCGPRSVTRANGQVLFVPLTGSVTVSEGGTVPLRMNLNDPELQALVNDQDGNLGVPYGNECVFSEKAPNLGVTGVLWSTDADGATFSVSQPDETRTITNDYTAVGDGLLISQLSGSSKAFARRVAYTVSCTASDGEALDLGEFARIELGDDPTTAAVEETSVIIPAAMVPAGSTCDIAEAGRDPGTRPKLNGQQGDFPIDRDSTVTTLDENVTGEPQVFNDLAPIRKRVDVGTQSSVLISHVYDFIYTNITGTKSVEIDGGYISPARQEVKRNRQFNVSISCLLPDSADTPTTDSGVVSASTSLDFGAFPVGSDCSATEGATTTAAGISVKQEVSANGAPKTEKKQEFDVARGENTIAFTNTYSRRLSDVKLNKIARLPAAVEEQYKAAGKTPGFYTHTFDMDCRDPETGDGSQGFLLGTFTGTITGPGTTTFKGVPVGADCHIRGDKFGDLNLELEDKDGTLLKATLRPRQVSWVVDQNDGTALIDKDLADGITESQYFLTVDGGADGQVNNVVDLTNYYEYVTTKIKMSKAVIGRQGDLDLLNPRQEFDFTMQCKGVGYQYSELASDGKRIENAIFLNNGFTGYADAGNGSVSRTYTSPEVAVPAGAFCTFEETPPRGTPQELQVSVAKPKIAKYAGSTEDAPVESWDFVNRYERRTTPVRVSINQTGYLQGIDPNGYTAKFTCKDPQGSTFTKTMTTAETPVGASVATAAPAPGGFIVDLPVGVDCTMDLTDSPALAPRTQLAVTAGARTPATQFNSWIRDAAGEGAPSTPLSRIAPATVTEAQKNRQYTFNVPADLSSTETELVVGAENHNFRGVADVTFTKTSAGNAGEGATFEFQQTCSQNDPTFTLKTGESRTFTSVPIDSPCFVQETNDGVAESNPILNVTQHGARIANPTVEQAPAPAPAPGEPLEENLRRVNFNVMPVESATDLSTQGAEWSLTAQNSFPGVQVDKKIDGSPISSITGAVADTAVLPDDATSMRMHYTITNTGAQSLSGFALKDPSLAGRKITNTAGTTLTVPDSGVIDPGFCQLATLQLASGNAHECVFDVEITEPTDSFFSYRGEVTVTANASDEAGAVSSTDTYGAIRLQKAIGWMLPDTGAQTLLIVILLGLLALAYGLYRYFRRRDDDEGEGFADNGPIDPDSNDNLDNAGAASQWNDGLDSQQGYDGQR